MMKVRMMMSKADAVNAVAAWIEVALESVSYLIYLSILVGVTNGTT